jgi:hypothetical protein
MKINDLSASFFAQFWYNIVKQEGKAPHETLTKYHYEKHYNKKNSLVRNPSR